MSEIVQDKKYKIQINEDYMKTQQVIITDPSTEGYGCSFLVDANQRLSVDKDLKVDGDITCKGVIIKELDGTATASDPNADVDIETMNSGIVRIDAQKGGTTSVGELTKGSIYIDKMTGGNTFISSMTGGSLTTTLSLSAFKTKSNLVLEQPSGSYNNGKVPADDKKWATGSSDKHQWFSIDLSGSTGTGTGYLYLIHCEVMYKSSTTSRHYLYYDSYGVFNGVQGCSGFDNPNISSPAGTLHLMCHKTSSHLYFQMYECNDAEGAPSCANDDSDFTLYAVANKNNDRRTCFNYIHVYRLPFRIIK